MDEENTERKKLDYLDIIGQILIIAILVVAGFAWESWSSRHKNIKSSYDAGTVMFVTHLPGTFEDYTIIQLKEDEGYRRKIVLKDLHSMYSGIKVQLHIDKNNKWWLSVKHPEKGKYNTLREVHNI